MPIDPACQSELVGLAQFRLSQRNATEPLTRDAIAQTVDQFLTTFPEWAAKTSREDAITQLNVMFSTFVGQESVLRGDQTHVPWLDSRRSTISWSFWERYRRWISGKLPVTAVNALNRVTDRTLELIGDPASPEPFNRRGMVVGDVQSGKTGNYAGLICKAADAGYKVIIVLAGMSNNLRSQTQIRLDESFIGKISGRVGDLNSREVGVGRIAPGLVVDWGTNRSETGDFRQRVMEQFGIHPGSHPLLLVVKKNGSVLKGILDWIEATGNSADDSGRRFSGKPLLMIDDEADQASVDTREQSFNNGVADPDHEPTRINARIRRILGRFDQASYVAYTATPFANIFIHPDAETSEEFQDLFPRDFIINIPAPDTYVGASRLFGTQPDDPDDPRTPGMPSLIDTIDDYADSTARQETSGWMPPMHRASHIPLLNGEREVPASLRGAIDSFALVVAARKVRGQLTEHNSMLIHVTRFKDVQRLVIEQVREALDDLQNGIRYGDGSVIARLEQRWADSFVPVTVELAMQDCPPVPWAALVPALRETVETIRLREINGSSADILDYEQNRDSGLNVIAVGGDKLARGLTLEGLSISYFLRGSRMYDTLMQMGRWFGYRPGYLDLCRLYTPEDLVDWYEHIAHASDELRREFDRMEAIRATPREFGLKVRTHPVMTVTSRVKMRHGTTMRVSFAGDISETTIFKTDGSTLRCNFSAAERLVAELQTSARHQPDPEQQRSGGRPHRWIGSHLWSEADPEAVLRFLEGYSTHEDAPRANTALMARYIRRQMSLRELTRWNVLLVGGDGNDPVQIAGLNIRPVLRQPKGGYGANPPYLTIQPGTDYRIRRLLAPRDETVDIGAEDYAAAMADTLANPPKRRRRDDGADTYDPAYPSGVYIRTKRPADTGLLLIYPLSRKGEIRQAPAPAIEHDFLEVPQNPVGMAISFPASTRAQSVEYVVNSLFGAADDADGET